MSDWRVPLTDIAMPEQDVQAVLDCLRSGWLTMGPRNLAFERALAAYVGTPHAVTVSSGTAALHLAFLAAGLGSGDEVIVPALTFVASAAAARYVGAEPVLCDIRGRAGGDGDPSEPAARRSHRHADEPFARTPSRVRARRAARAARRQALHRGPPLSRGPRGPRGPAG